MLAKPVTIDRYYTEFQELNEHGKKWCWLCSEITNDVYICIHCGYKVCLECVVFDNRKPVCEDCDEVELMAS